MLPELALKLVTTFEAYFRFKEFEQFAALFEVPLNTFEQYRPAEPDSWLPIVQELMTKLDHGNTRRLLDNLLDLADTRNSDGIARTSFERQAFHESMAPVIRQARELLETSSAASEITIPAGHTFSAKSKVRELLETTTTEILIVDQYIGVGTLDCLRNIALPIRLLTGALPNSIESGFEPALAAFQAEGHQVQVRRATQLHDRHIVFNDRCWLVGSSLKDAGKKPFNCIEISDQKAEVITGLEVRWTNGTPHP